MYFKTLATFALFSFTALSAIGNSNNALAKTKHPGADAGTEVELASLDPDKRQIGVLINVPKEPVMPIKHLCPTVQNMLSKAKYPTKSICRAIPVNREGGEIFYVYIQGHGERIGVNDFIRSVDRLAEDSYISWKKNPNPK